MKDPKSEALGLRGIPERSRRGEPSGDGKKAWEDSVL